MKKRYSIIVPHYNNFQGIKKLLSSIPSRDDIEIIVVDDNSDIDESEIRFISERCKFAINEKGKNSAGTCRNIGMSLATGHWLIFADSDDYFVDKAFDRFDKYSLKRSDVVYFNVTSQIEDTNNLSDRHVQINSLVNRYIDDNDIELNYKHAVPWGKMVRHEFVKNNKLTFDEVIASNDVIFSLGVGMKATKITASKDCVYCVIRRNESLTKVRSYAVLRSRFDVVTRRNALLQDRKLIKYQICAVSLLIQYRDVMNSKDVINLVRSCFLRKQRVFPKIRTYQNYKAKLVSLIRKEF